MLRLQNGINIDECESISGEDEVSADSDEGCFDDAGIPRTLDYLGTSPFVIGDLQIINLGNSLYSCTSLLTLYNIIWMVPMHCPHFDVIIVERIFILQS